MAVTTQNGTEYAAVYVTKPPALVSTAVWHGRVRQAFVSHTQSGAGDAGSSVALFKLPPGTVRLILPLSYLYVNWTTASATLDLGWDAYTALDGTAVAADADGLINGLDVDTADVYGFEELTASAGAGATTANAYAPVFTSRDGVVIRATSTDVALADASALAGVLTYVQD